MQAEVAKTRVKHSVSFVFILVPFYLFQIRKHPCLFDKGFQDTVGSEVNEESLYRLSVPANVPVKNFWAVTAYDVGTRAVLENKTGKFGCSTAYKPYKKNSDGRTDLYIGPKKPNRCT